MITFDKYIKERENDPEYKAFLAEEKKLAELAVMIAKERINLVLPKKNLPKWLD